ncbi:39S ribosomal protein L21, mitochondrial-like [Daphnia pulex]|uniref:39S ribosomal protein L21, mitochondrial-like n=1 Tax=Daphnia pulex TaxID=6669 RepID=UPI001EE047EC|nr:39S ribosomal protein L21, mitochondrial-like [Daphnia pulex]
MAALMFRNVLSKLSQLQITPIKSLRPNGIISCTSSANYVLQAQAIEKCAIRMLRSEASNNFEGTKLNASQQTSAKPQQEVLENQHESEIAITKETIAKVNSQIELNSHGRLFAVIHLAGKQRRVTDGDLIMIEGAHPADVGDVIRAEKVLLLGSRDFTLIGRPLLRPDLVRVEATVVEKSLTHTKTVFRNRRRKNTRSINFCRSHFSIMRINCVRLEGLVDQRPEIEGVDGRIF